MQRKWLPNLSSQRLMFNRLTAQILAWKSNLQREENRSTRRETLGVRLPDRQISAHVRTRSRVVDVGGATDDHYANLIPIPWIPDSSLMYYGFQEKNISLDFSFIFSKTLFCNGFSPLRLTLYCSDSTSIFSLSLCFWQHLPILNPFLFWNSLKSQLNM